jgi:gas vesicle protein
MEVMMQRALAFILGATVGGVIGAAAAILFAPFSGVELRNQISDRAQAFADDIRQAANTRRIELQERLEVLRTPEA